MNKTLTTVFLALVGGAFTSSMHKPAVMPLPGPGGVASAVKAFLASQEKGQSTAALLANSRHAAEFVYGDGQLQQIEAKKATSPAFMDVRFDGRPFAARTVERFVTQIDNWVASERASNQDEDGRVLQHEIRSLRADCHSDACSLAIVEFTRIYTVGGGKQMHVPMRATALLRYERAQGGSFRIYHWHASRAK